MNTIRSALRTSVPKLTAEESADLPSHMSYTRNSIFDIEREINVTRTNLLTIARCMQVMLPSVGPCTLVSGSFGIFDLPRAIADLEESCSQISEDQQELIRQQELKRTTTFPTPLIHRPVVIPDSERTICSPRSLNRAYIATLKMTAEGSYQLLKVKKQELKLELDKLEADIKRWGDIYAHLSSQIPETSLQQPKPILSTSASFSSSRSTLAGPISEEGKEVVGQEHKDVMSDLRKYETTFAIKRKAVPVNDIVKRTLSRAVPCTRKIGEQMISPPPRSRYRPAPAELPTVVERVAPPQLHRQSIPQPPELPAMVAEPKDIAVEVKQPGMDARRHKLFSRGSSRTL